MPAVSIRGTRRRRSMNEINMVPFIDVMLVLLIIFMVTAPLITTGVVDLPSVGRSQQRPPAVIEVIVGTDERLRIRLAGSAGGAQAEPEAVTLPQLAARVRSQQASAGGGTAAGAAEVPVVISADRSVRYESVVRVMDTLQRAGVRRVGLSVKQAG
jgi:biopolymer transport protein TolR